MSQPPHTLRRLITLSALACLALGAGAPGQTTQVRIMASNLTSGSNQSYLDPGERILEALQPDIALMQEFTIGATASQSTADTDAFVLRVFGPGYTWMREPGDEQIPNGIISRWPILESGQWEDPNVDNRDFAYARIDIPGDHDLWAVSVHLLTTGSTDRNSEAQDLRDAIIAHGIPATDHLVIGGDLNTGSRTESAISTLSALVVTSSPFPEDQSGDGDTNSGRTEPYDWVLVDSDLDPLETSVVQGSFTFPTGLVFDTRIFTQTQLNSSFPPALTSDSAATGMQHMGVVRDFLVPNGAVDDFTVLGTSVDFGTVDATAGPFTDSSISLDVTNPFILSGLSLTGTHPGEFTLLSPAVPSTISADTDLVFRWTPAANDGQTRSVDADLTTAGSPAEFTVTLSGQTNSAPSGDPIDVSGYTLEQITPDAAITFPAGTEIASRGFLIVGRDASRAAFESFWGVTLGSDVVYISGMDVIGGNGFPVINGDEQFLLLDDGGLPLDPPSGHLPTSPIADESSYQRSATDGTAFTQLPEASANPGAFTGIVAETGEVVITEIGDAAGTGNYVYSFVELYHDATAETPATLVGFMAR
ncbi:endonuclease/exonuclease/phosphatase family protein [Candidatus Sumerlaeota bacterium]|nr:endonuclease/exonuclease/phosphatase family protein [Candidatus Sumerlaeota bacterium]